MFFLIHPSKIHEIRIHRTLIATIKDFGTYPCPWCLVTIDQICALGRESDRKLREELCREDNNERRRRIDNAHKSLYDEGYAIAGDHVDGILKDESQIPTKVFALTFTCS